MSADANVWQVDVGLDDKFNVEIIGGNNQPIAFVGDEALIVQCWQGDDTAATGGLVSASWTGGNPTAGRCVLTIAGSATAGLAPDFYRLRLLVVYTDGSRYKAWDGWLSLGDSPGSALPPATYCTLQDLLDHGGDWVFGHMTETGRTSFMADRSRARAELDKVILARARPDTLSTENLRRAGFGDWAPEQPNAYLKGLLDADQLIVDQDVRSATAYLSLAFICERAQTWGTDDVFHTRARYYRARWKAVIANMVAQIDTNADGVGDYIFNLGYFSIR